MRNCIKYLSAIAFTAVASISFGQANDCGEEDNVCTQPDFTITSDVSTDLVEDFGSGTGSNPSTNPNALPGNSGCLLSGETSSTFMLINVVSDGVLEWSIGEDNSTGCYDWIMWPYQTDGTTCDQLQAGTLPPVACNWNGACEGFTGMANPGNMPPGAEQSSWEYGLDVQAGDQFLLCLSNFSFQDLDVSINFFGSADVSCDAFTADQTICKGDVADVSIVVSGFVNPTYTWNTTNGVISDPATGPDFQVSPNVTTDYEVYLSEGGLTDTVEFTITVFDNVDPDAGLDLDGCFGGQIALNGSVSDPANTYGWTFEGPAGTPAPPNLVFTPNSSSLTPSIQANYPGAYNVILTEDNGVCPALSDTAVVTFHEVSQNLTSTNPLCADSCNGTITSTSATAIEYSIDGMNWVAGNVFSDLCDGNYTIHVRDQYGCEANDDIVLTDPLAIVLTVSNDTTICENGTVTLNASAINGNTFNFHWGHTADLNGTQMENPLVNTQYTVYAESDNGCISNTLDIDVSMHPPLDLSISVNDTICPTDPSTITVVANGGIGAPYTYNWYAPGGVNPAGTNSLTVNPSTDTWYYIEVTDGCETSPDTVSTLIKMADMPTVDFVADTTQACEPGSFRLSNLTEAHLSENITWKISDGQELINLPIIDIEIQEPGLYDVELIIETSRGCMDSITKPNYLWVHENPIAQFTNSPVNPTMFNPIAEMTNLSVGGFTYEWDFGPLANPVTSTEYEPTVTYPDAVTGVYPVQLIVTSEYNCKDTVEMDIEVIPELLLYVPNAFTPDGDTYNEVFSFVIDGIDIGSGFEMIIFDRWGEIVWQTNDPTGTWDGKYKGKLVETGIYVWTLTAKDVVNDRKYYFNGHLNVLY